MKTILLLVLWSFLFISINGQATSPDMYYKRAVKKVFYSGTDINVIVSGSIRSSGGGNPAEEDPLAGILVWFVSNGEDGSMTEARILRGTTHYKPDPDTLRFVSNSGINYLYLCVITTIIGDTNSYVSKFYEVKVNDSTYQIGLQNVIELDSLLLTTMIDRYQDQQPNTFTLKQNYPNPFNPSTIIEYEVVERTSVRIAIFNSNGELVRLYNEGEKLAGTYTLTWNGKDQTGKRVASGTYYYQLQSDKSVQAKKMILLK